MSTKADVRDTVRASILSEPEVVLEDQDVMRALIDANERTHGSNIVDLRGIAMERLEARLDRLEETHKAVIAAAYDNLAGTNLVHNAALRVLDPVDFPSFLKSLATELPEALKVTAVRLILESRDPLGPSVGFDEVLRAVGPGVVDHYITAGRDIAVRPVTLRQVSPASPEVYGDQAPFIKSEALIRLDLGNGRLPGLLVMGSENPHQFRPSQGTDLLSFFGGVFERSIRRHLA
ncbi:DUF484 family protein [Litoreibacter roseus]|uniref:Tyrosine recombinase XerC n=1 Tax=Litoreibacter roseus TaxID=2601869 RepID=A0A6N6JIL8_9RHOB|nr:DUF484 family protein [Litoreibacter roseus]GFE65259.1 tyrosine recombinase XerC [Litoreibacter roseus]